RGRRRSTPHVLVLPPAVRRRPRLSSELPLRPQHAASRAATPACRRRRRLAAEWMVPTAPRLRLRGPVPAPRRTSVRISVPQPSASRAATAPAPLELGVVIPTFKEAPNVRPLLARLEAALTGVAWQAIFVDDDSPDGTAAEVKAIAAVDPRVICLR